MILQKMDVASKMLGAQVTEKAFVVSLVQFFNFGHLYKDAVVEYQNEYFSDRTNYIHCNFTSCMIAISNNCEVFQVGIFIRKEKLLNTEIQFHEFFQELAQDLKNQWWKCIKSDQGIMEATMKFDQLINLFKSLNLDSVNYLLDELCLDIQNNMAEILTLEWAKPEDTHAIDTLVVTLTDYFKDYIHLKTDIFKLLTNLCQERIAKNYIVSLLQPRTLLSKRITIETGKKKHVALKSRTNSQF